MRKLFLNIYQLTFIIHGYVFMSSSQKELIVEDLYNQGQRRPGKFKTYMDLLQKLASDKYFRTLFYFRTAGPIVNLLRIVFPRDNRLTIDINTKIGGGVVLAHPYSSIINAERIGKNLYINQLVTIGENNGKKPIIGNNVKLYTNSTIIGGITIGDNVVVGAGSVVVKDVPSNSVVAGNPAKIIRTIQ